MNVGELSKAEECICAALGPCIVINEQAFDPASLAPYVEPDRSLIGRSHTWTPGRLSVSTSSRSKVNRAHPLESIKLFDSWNVLHRTRAGKKTIWSASGWSS